MNPKLKYTSLRWKRTSRGKGLPWGLSTTLLVVDMSVALTLILVPHFTVSLLISFYTTSSVKRLHNFLPHLFINANKYHSLNKKGNTSLYHIVFWHYIQKKKTSLDLIKYCDSHCLFYKFYSLYIFWFCSYTYQNLDES